MNLLNWLGKIGRSRAAVASFLAALLLAQAARADLLELTNGDHYRGTVVSMSTTNVEFISEIQGRVLLPRSKVAQITFHEVMARPVAAKPLGPVTNAPLIVYGPTAPTPGSGGIAIARNSPAPGAAASASGSAVVAQMRQQGMDPKLVSQVQEQIFGKASPEAAAKFNEMMGGLLSGQLSIKDIRAQAQRGIDQIREAKKDLGPDAGEMLDGYLGILQKFLQETEADNTPPVSQTTPAAPAPVK